MDKKWAFWIKFTVTHTVSSPSESFCMWLTEASHIKVCVDALLEAFSHVAPSSSADGVCSVFVELN